MKVLLVDDEKKARETIFNILEIYCPEVEVIAEAASAKEAIEAIEKHQPDLVFLDINMPGGNGFEVLQHFKTIDFKIIFITAYEQYALQALKLSALDYLLKPINADELAAAVKRASIVIEKENFNKKIQTLLVNTDILKAEYKRIVLKTNETIHIVPIQDIIRCESERNYTTFFLSSGKKIVMSNTLKEYEELLSSYRFFRIHNSHLINMDYILSYEKKEGGYFVMKDNSRIPVTAGKKDLLLSIIENF